jgi:hypothetical protein
MPDEMSTPTTYRHASRCVGVPQIVQPDARRPADADQLDEGAGQQLRGQIVPSSRRQTLVASDWRMLRSF